jgi:L-amino acid N-acyltransferase YncA
MYDLFDMQQHDYSGVVDPTGFDPSTLVNDNADQHFAVIGPRDTILARCSLWWRDTPIVDGSPVGAIGHYAADDSQSAGVLLAHACRVLKARGAGYAIGPMDGNTWRRYRFVTERGTAKPFFLEPDNPDDWPDHFGDSGFAACAHYVSELNPDFPNRQPALGTLPEKFRRTGVSVEPIDPAAGASDLNDIYAVICEAFAGSPLYTPLDYESFIRLYAPLLSAVDPRLMLVARHEGRIVGFIFSPPDFLQGDNPDGIDTIVIKTVAILPRSEYSGLGRILIVELLRNAEAMGFRQAISALMHTENRSQKISSGCAGPMRAYAVYARELNG